MRRERLSALLFMAPALLLLGLFVVAPALNIFRYSFFDMGLTDPAPRGEAGLDNYRALLSDPSFRRSVRNTAWFTVLVVPLQTLAALGLAVWTQGPGWSRRFVRLAVFVPTAMSLTVLSVLWALLLEPATATGSGLINGLLGAAGLPTQPFLQSTAQALPAIALMSVWQGAGLQMLVFLSGLQQIPSQLYEAAEVDGAGRWGRFLHVTLPGVAPTGAFVLMITTIFSLKLFVQPFLITQGGPQGATISMVQYLYEAAFFRRDLGLSCAAGALFFVAVCLLAFGQRLLLRRVEDQA